MLDAHGVLPCVLNAFLLCLVEVDKMARISARLACNAMWLTKGPENSDKSHGRHNQWITHKAMHTIIRDKQKTKTIHFEE